MESLKNRICILKIIVYTLIILHLLLSGCKTTRVLAPFTPSTGTVVVTLPQVTTTQTQILTQTNTIFQTITAPTITMTFVTTALAQTVTQTVLAPTQTITVTTQTTVTAPQTTTATTPPTTTAIPSTTSVVPLPVNPNNGNASGHLEFMDGSPAYPNQIYIFVQGAGISLKSTGVNNNGDYYFSDLPAGNYEIYAAIYKDYSLSTPDATIHVNAQQTTAITVIMVPKEIPTITCNGIILTIGSIAPYYVTVTGQLNLSWTGISTADAYSITITADYPNQNGYNHLATSTNAGVIWPSLSSGNYWIQVKALKNGQVIGIGSEYFIVNP